LIQVVTSQVKFNQENA